MAVFNGPAIRDEILNELLSSVSSPEQLLGKEGLLKQLTARLVEKALQGEMTAHLGFEPGTKPPGAENGRNGYTHKTLATDHGEITIDVPRDRNGTFEESCVPWEPHPHPFLLRLSRRPPLEASQGHIGAPMTRS
jgi:transposase-like protein